MMRVIENSGLYTKYRFTIPYNMYLKKFIQKFRDVMSIEGESDIIDGDFFKHVVRFDKTAAKDAIYFCNRADMDEQESGCPCCGEAHDTKLLRGVIFIKKGIIIPLICLKYFSDNIKAEDVDEEFRINWKEIPHTITRDTFLRTKEFMEGEFMEEENE